MLSRSLLRDATNALTRSRTGHASPPFLQRTIRVGFATASQLCQALEDAGVLGPLGRGLDRPIRLTDGIDGAHCAVRAAIADGRIRLDVDEEAKP